MATTTPHKIGDVVMMGNVMGKVRGAQEQKNGELFLQFDHEVDGQPRSKYVPAKKLGTVDDHVAALKKKAAAMKGGGPQS